MASRKRRHSLSHVDHLALNQSHVVSGSHSPDICRVRLSVRVRFRVRSGHQVFSGWR